jgi:hypothetical protein
MDLDEERSRGRETRLARQLILINVNREINGATAHDSSVKIFADELGRHYG